MHDNTLSQREHYILTALTASAEPQTAQHAQALLRWAQGEACETIAQTTSVSSAQVQDWINVFAQKRLAVFSPGEVERAVRGIAGLTTINALLKQHEVDPAHPRYVAILALQIFDQALAIHQLSRAYRGLLATAALLHTVGMSLDANDYQRAGREIILAHELENLSSRDRDILACLIHFHRQQVKPSQDPIFAALDEDAQSATLKLAAMLRVADGLDDSQSQSTRLQSIHANEFVDVVVEGPQAAADAKRANKRADLWRQVLAPPFHVRQPHELLPTHETTDEPDEKHDPQEPITRAGQRIIRKQFDKLRACEDEVRMGGNVDAVHDMRVAARRMRSAFRLLRAYYVKKNLKGVRKPLRALARRLGDVRDLDVLIAHAREYVATLPHERQQAIGPLLTDWLERRQAAQRKVIDFMDGKKYGKWKSQMKAFLKSKAPPHAPRVCDEVPVLVWAHYVAVRAYESRVSDAPLSTLHELRIQCKRLRYVLEFFEDVLGDATPALVESLTALQDQLGALHDADVASQMIVKFIADQTSRPQALVDTTVLQEATAYLSAMQNRIGELRATFPERWQLIVAPAFRKGLAEAVAEI